MIRKHAPLPQKDSAIERSQTEKKPHTAKKGRRSDTAWNDEPHYRTLLRLLPDALVLLDMNLNIMMANEQALAMYGYDTAEEILGESILRIIPSDQIDHALQNFDKRLKSGDAVQVAEKIVEAFREPFLIDGHELRITISVGIAVYPSDGMDPDALVKNADIAMYQAKQEGRNRYERYHQT